MSLSKVEITKHWSDGLGVVGYAEGTLGGREFTASWATFCPPGTVFYDTWLDATDAQVKAIARALRDKGAVPVPSL